MAQQKEHVRKAIAGRKARSAADLERIRGRFAARRAARETAAAAAAAGNVAPHAASQAKPGG